jgi:hypothetical protein
MRQKTVALIQQSINCYYKNTMWHYCIIGVPQCDKGAVTEDTSAVGCGGLWLRPHAPFLREPANRDGLRLAA